MCDIFVKYPISGDLAYVSQASLSTGLEKVLVDGNILLFVIYFCFYNRKTTVIWSRGSTTSPGSLSPSIRCEKQIDCLNIQLFSFNLISIEITSVPLSID